VKLFSTPRSKGILFARLAGVLLLLAIVSIRIADPIVVQNLRNQSFDLIQRLSPRPVSKQPVAIVDIDENSLESVGQWPWPRTRIAELVDKLTAMGAIAIGFDIIFAEPDRLSPEKIAEDNEGLPEPLRAGLRQLPSNEVVLADAIKRSRVIVGETSARHGQDQQVEPDETRQIPDVPYAQIGADPKPFMRKFPRLVQNLPVISEAAAGRGLFTVSPEPDGIFRRMPLVMMVEDKIRLALSAETLRIATGGQSFATRADEAGISGVVVGGVFVPTDRNGNIWPWFNPSRRDRYVSAGSVLDGTAPMESIRGHMILIGTSAVGLEDFRATPVANSMPGVEIHAQIIENIITGEYLTRPYYALGMEVIFIAIFGIAMIWLIPRTGAIVASLAAIGVTASFVAGTLWAFYAHRLMIDGVFPAAALLAIFVLMATANYIREEIEKRQIRGAFGQYLSPALVDQLTEDPDRLVLGGETRPLTLLFTDVRGFTGISESYKDDPQGLTRLMNRFLTSLSEAILEEDGTIDKYMGDAIMAFWNAPIDQEDHPARACRAAIKMVERLEELNDQGKASGSEDAEHPWQEIKIGIGLNTGECVVGNMGSDMRFDYTALGDTVNLASRLEGQSKPYGFQIIMGDHTAGEVADEFAVMEIDLIRVKGKTEPERIHVLIGGKEVLETEEFRALKAMNRMMLASYRNQDWTSAYQALEELGPLADKLNFNLDEYQFIYETRISEFKYDPPGKGWDGVFTATEK
jgi:adenylate cyclase